MFSYMSVLHAFYRVLENAILTFKSFFLLASTGRLGRSSCMSFRCWQMVPGWHSELGRRLCSTEQAWRLHPCHQTAGMDPWNHKHIAEPGPAIIWQPKQKNTNVERHEYLVQSHKPYSHKQNAALVVILREKKKIIWIELAYVSDHLVVFIIALSFSMTIWLLWLMNDLFHSCINLKLSSALVNQIKRFIKYMQIPL